jgi:hypothetical protein
VERKRLGEVRFLGVNSHRETPNPRWALQGSILQKAGRLCSFWPVILLLSGDLVMNEAACMAALEQTLGVGAES